ncbi:hypothetical protein [Ammoniphilus oxalaticus]|uniref:hypothetical protein n=1 Tax=Ammoniphilus oxalaticus TaxID=66863 RepID=UPI000E73FD4A|nr:hypothetical protein [Ammoniphilus oxalaticus]
MMRFGLSGSSGGLEALTIERQQSIIPQLEAWGYSSIWINEEHFLRPNVFSYSPLILGAAFASLSS